MQYQQSACTTQEAVQQIEEEAKQQAEDKKRQLEEEARMAAAEADRIQREAAIHAGETHETHETHVELGVVAKSCWNTGSFYS